MSSKFVIFTEKKSETVDPTRIFIAGYVANRTCRVYPETGIHATKVEYYFLDNENIMEVQTITKSTVAGGINITIKWSEHEDLIISFEGVNDIPCIGDFALMSILGEAMALKQDIRIPDEFPVSETLLANLNRWQQIFASWYPYLHSIKISARSIPDRAPVNGSCTLFSGGMDSFYTLIREKDDIDNLLFCVGMDIQLEEKERAVQARENYEQLAREMDKNLVVVTTNIRHVFKHYDSGSQHALIFASFAIAIGARRLYIPASHDIRELFPWASHLLTDPLFSNGTTDVIHHGAVLRSEKTRYLAQDPHVMKYLRVCNAEDSYNCGRCEKCLRTMFALAAIQVSSPAIPDLESKWKLLTRLKIYKESQYTFWRDNVALAKQCGNEKLAKAAERICRNYRFRRWIREGMNLMRG